MYLQHFALTHYPFDHTLHTDELFDSRAAQEVSGRIAHLVDLRGIGLITGEAGCGKTTVCRKAADQLHPSLHRVCYASPPAPFWTYPPSSARCTAMLSVLRR